MSVLILADDKAKVVSGQVEKVTRLERQSIDRLSGVRSRLSTINPEGAWDHDIICPNWRIRRLSDSPMSKRGSACANCPVSS